MVSNAADKNNGVFYMFYDNGQFLYGNSNPLPKMLSEEDCVVLSVNCRNTQYISKTAGSVVDVYPLVKGPDGEKPRFYICENNGQAVNQICELVKKYKENEKEEERLKDEDIAILSVGAEGRKDVLDAVEPKIRNSSPNVRRMTVRQFKGLEAKAVILVDAFRYFNCT